MGRKMYQQNPEFEEPAADTIIWRYVDFTKFISYLEKNALFFVRSDQLSDKYEGSFTEADAKLWEDKLKPETKLSQIEIYDMFRKFVNISSWHINDNESAAMWEICLQSNEGVAIKSTFKRLKDSFIPHKEDEILIGKVKYIDYTRDSIPKGNIFNPFLYKRKAFEHERELRAVIMKFAPQEETVEKHILYVNPKWFGIHVKTDLDVLINKIVVSPNVPDWFIDLVTSIVKKYELNKKVEQSELSKEPQY
jgi:tmRNA-binding protein